MRKNSLSPASKIWLFDIFLWIWYLSNSWRKILSCLNLYRKYRKNPATPRYQKNFGQNNPKGKTRFTSLTEIVAIIPTRRNSQETVVSLQLAEALQLMHCVLGLNIYY